MDGRNLQEIIPSIKDFMEHPAISRAFFALGFYSREEDKNNEVTEDMLYDLFRNPNRDSSEYKAKLITFSNSYRGTRKPKLEEMKRLKLFLASFILDINSRYEKLNEQLGQIIDKEEKITNRKAKIEDILADPEVAALLKKKGY